MTFEAESGQVVGPDDARWQRYTVGGGAIQSEGERLRLLTRDARRGHYADAQLDDYGGLPRRRFLWRPPVSLRLRARFSHASGVLKGTAGFGFWNDPFGMSGRRLPALPGAVWFFYASPPSNMALALDVPGRGWKAAALDAARPAALALAPLTPLAVALMNIRTVYRWLWPRLQRALAIEEALLDEATEMTDWHAYQLDWLPDGARFHVDGRPVLQTRHAPRGPLGFVMWLDNQYAVVTPQGRLGWGVLGVPGEQWMDVEDFSISAGWIATRPPLLRIEE